MIKDNHRLFFLIIPIIIIFFNIIVMVFPKEIIFAAKVGISLWFNNVFPSLLPFIIGTNLLMNLGIVAFIGTILSPIMYPLFGVNGAGGFALITGMTSGYPMGAKTVASLREKGLVSKIEAQRLLSFTNNSGPLFVIGTIGVGMFSSAEIGYFILFIHFFSAIITGFIFKFYKYTHNTSNKNTINNFSIFKVAYKNMMTSRLNNKRSFGQILGDSIKNSMESILIIGGFIILFCVIVKILEITKIIDIFINLIPFLKSNELEKGIIIGIIEITNGVMAISSLPHSYTSILFTCAIISFGGFSIHAQTISFTSKTDINFCTYIISKVIHSLISLIIGITLINFIPLKFNTNETIQVFNNVFIFSKLAISSMLFIFSIFVIFLLFIIFYIFKIFFRLLK